ncbi:MAG: elongation factor P [Bacteroidales bacterium]|nr:elongation factor P [Bacteroidales bacterium]MCF8344172.1 elongation factor P [Bacteroidales bacterium]MCF8350828.1 elongation factor P [Bacteroidales bacterium]MCF8375383.1 elongation factor P [Bacteroidales bacterium]MCF8401278.1 elongation factor P [Bacteroidales bacterium]
MATTADFRNGMVIEHNGELCAIVEFQHVKPGKGGAFVRTKLKNITSGKVLQHTFNAGVKINVQRVERRPYQFLYKESDTYHFMNMETFEQTFVNENTINAPQFLKESQQVDIVFHADTETPLFCELPAYVDLEITYTEPGVKGDTATNTLKEATVETGAMVKVPLFIEQGEKIKVDTRTGEYSERVKQ